MPERDFHAVYGVDSRVAGRSTAQNDDACLRYKAHMHEVVLNRLGQVERHHNPGLADRQLTENTHPPDSAGPPERQNP